MLWAVLARRGDGVGRHTLPRPVASSGRLLVAACCSRVPVTHATAWQRHPVPPQTVGMVMGVCGRWVARAAAAACVTQPPPE